MTGEAQGVSAGQIAERGPRRIQEMDAQERPRERLEAYGAHDLALRELLAIQLRTGLKGRSALELAEDLLHSFGGIKGLAGASVAEMEAIHGVGKSKAVQIAAGIELGKRLYEAHAATAQLINNPQGVYDLLWTTMRDERQEIFVALALDTKNQLIRRQALTRGTVNASLVDAREVFHLAVSLKASSLIVAHNHPSGDPSPSKADLDVTRRLVQAGQILDIPLNDHVVIGHNRYTSLRATTDIWANARV